ncbi:MAG: GNAT family N-acetyltransferase [Oscillospiraceae bacterium]|nr:GNAT family N-acetyltransferase [Oscillospiraceae bacterium]
MDHIRIETNRLILRRFEETDMEAIYLLFSDKEVNTYLPWYPVANRKEAKDFFARRLKDRMYCFAICLKDDDRPIGYVHAESDDSHDFGYALRREYWRQGIVSEASGAVIELLKGEGIAYITATHDRNNPRSGAVMKRIGMKYCYSYKEQWQPKNFPVIFRMYQLNLDGQTDRVFQKYWDLYDDHFIETDI